MKNTRSPIPFMLFIPIALLIAVLASAFYHWPATEQDDSDTHLLNTLAPDPISKVVFGDEIKGPLSIRVPEVNSTAVMDTIERKSQTVSGRYIAGAERGRIAVIGSLLQKTHIHGQTVYIMPFRVTNQGSGSFYYIGLFTKDESNNGVTSIGSHFIGERIALKSLAVNENKVSLHYLALGAKQAMSEDPQEPQQLEFTISSTLEMQFES